MCASIRDSSRGTPRRGTTRAPGAGAIEQGHRENPDRQQRAAHIGQVDEAVGLSRRRLEDRQEERRRHENGRGREEAPHHRLQSLGEPGLIDIAQGHQRQDQEDAGMGARHTRNSSIAGRVGRFSRLLYFPDVPPSVGARAVNIGKAVDLR